MVPWVERPTIDVDLARSEEERFRHVPPEVFGRGRRLLDAVLREVPAGAQLLADAVRLRTLNRFHAEAVALAQQVGADWRDVLLASISYDLALAQVGCSTVALPTPHGPLLARNMDWWPEDLLAQASYQIRCFKGEKIHFVSAGFPGAIGIVSGQSARGFAVVLNAVMSPEGACRTGYPVLLHLRRVVEDAPDFRHALAMLTEQTLTTGALFTLVGRENEERVVIERTPTRHAHRWPQAGGPLFATNDYRLLDRPHTVDSSPLDETTCARYDALCRFLGNHTADGDVTDSQILYVLSDPSVIQTITCQHVIFRPSRGEARLFVPRRLVEGQEAGGGKNPSSAS